MAAKKPKSKALPSVLAFEKKLVPSDGYMYAVNWDNRLDEVVPLHLTEKSVRGTISNRLKDAVKNDPAKLNAEVEKPNLQTVDACALPMDKDTLKLKFTLKVLSGVEQPSACNDADFAAAYRKVAQNYIKRYGFAEPARRYAANIANARFLWRNRLGAEQVEVCVKAKNPEVEQSWTFNAYDFTLKDFPATDKTKQLSNLIAAALCGTSPYLLLEIEAFALLGKGQEVYPSEELVLDKGRGDKSKVLYQVDDVAAMHSQKLGNALRTIDTWYPDFADSHIGPIAVEPYGAVTNLGTAFRPPTSKKDFYSLFDNYAYSGDALPGFADENDEHYVMAVLVRGGVFGESSKE